MKLKNGKLVDYNYEDVKNIVVDAARKWTREEQHDLIHALVDEIQKAHGEEFRKRFIGKFLENQ